MERHSENAVAVARFLTEHPKVTWVNYPGLPTPSGLRPARRSTTIAASSARSWASASRAGCEAGTKFIESVKLFSHLANIGDAKSLIIHPASTTHSQLTEEEQADRRHAGLRAPLGRHRDRLRPDRRPRPGAGQGLIAAETQRGEPNRAPRFRLCDIAVAPKGVLAAALRGAVAVGDCDVLGGEADLRDRALVGRISRRCERCRCWRCP